MCDGCIIKGGSESLAFERFVAEQKELIKKGEFMKVARTELEAYEEKKELVADMSRLLGLASNIRTMIILDKDLTEKYSIDGYLEDLLADTEYTISQLEIKLDDLSLNHSS